MLFFTKKYNESVDKMREFNKENDILLKTNQELKIKNLELKISFDDILSKGLKNGFINDFEIKKIDFSKEKEFQDYFEVIEELEYREVDIIYGTEEI